MSVSSEKVMAVPTGARDETLERRVSQLQHLAPVQAEMRRPRVHGKFLYRRRREVLDLGG